MKRLICPICKRERKRSETMAICPNENDQRIIGRICKNGDCPARAMVVRTAAGYAIVDRVAAIAAKSAVAGEVAAGVYNELPAPAPVRNRTAYIMTGMKAEWRRADAPKLNIDDYVAGRLQKRRGR